MELILARRKSREKTPVLNLMVAGERSVTALCPFRRPLLVRLLARHIRLRQTGDVLIAGDRAPPFPRAPPGSERYPTRVRPPTRAEPE